jgi:opacity protein-like surface antigen
MKKITTTMVLVLCFSTLAVRAQYSSEWTLHAGAGNTMYKFDADNDDAKGGFGGNLGIKYTRFFSRYVGISLSAEAARYNNSLTLDERSSEEQIATPPDLEGSFFLRTNCDGIEETQTATFVQLPLMLHLQFPISQRNYFYLAAGAKYGIPLTATAKQTVSTMTTIGYSDHTEYIYRDMPEHGFSTEHDVKLSNKLKLPNITILAAEAGFKWQTVAKCSLYTGVFLDADVMVGIKIGLAFGGGGEY